MSLKKLQDHEYSSYSLSLYPSRTWTSGSAGITGSVFVFPNRSITQKDNIDDRLAYQNEDGTFVTPYGYDSLEAKREQIFSGKVSNLTAGPFIDNGSAEILSYYYDARLKSLIGTADYANTLTWNVGDTVFCKIGKFTYTSNNNWAKASDFAVPVTYTELPSRAEQRHAGNLEPAIALLLDGAMPGAEDHYMYGYDVGEWETAKQFDPSSPLAQIQVVNNTYNPGTPALFTGRVIELDEAGIPYKTKLITSKSECNPWPPELAKHGQTINSNFLPKGYSDFSMHPRNATAKDIRISRASESFASKGSLIQKCIYTKMQHVEGVPKQWTIDRGGSLNLSEYENDSATRRPSIVFDNQANEYGITTGDGFTIDMRIKPSELQTEEGVLCHVWGNYAISIKPDLTRKLGDKITYFNVAVYWGSDSETLANATTETNYLIPAEVWSKITIRYSNTFNNGKFDIFMNRVLIHEDTTIGSVIEGITAQTSELFVVGGLWSGHTGTSGELQNTLGAYGDEQGWILGPGSSTYAMGYDFDVTKQFKSEICRFLCYNTALTQKEMADEELNLSRLASDYRWHLDFSFRPMEASTYFPALWFKGNSEATSDTDEENNSISDFYRQGTYLPLQPSERTVDFVPYDSHASHIVGMQINSIHTYLYDRANDSWPIITGFPNFSDVSIYPDIDGQKLSVMGLNYFREKWEQFPWIHCLNSTIIPRDLGLWDDYKNSLHNKKNYNSDQIELDNIGVGDITSEYSLLHIAADERFEALIRANDLGDNIIVPNSNTINGYLESEPVLPSHSVIIDIPQIYYGDSIKRKSFEISGSLNGKPILLQDDDGYIYRGLLEGYRQKVGVIDYDVGCVILFHPGVTCIIHDDISIHFQGTTKRFIKQYDLALDKGAGRINNNPYSSIMKASENANDDDTDLCVISTINLHDDKLNIIGKAKLANPVMKRKNDNFLFRLRLDF